MTALQTCPQCGARVKFSNVKDRGGLTSKVRTCQCGHVDRILIRQEIAAILEVAQRVKKLSAKDRRRKQVSAQATERRSN